MDLTSNEISDFKEVCDSMQNTHPDKANIWKRECLKWEDVLNDNTGESTYDHIYPMIEFFKTWLKLNPTCSESLYELRYWESKLIESEQIKTPDVGRNRKRAKKN